MTVGKICSRIVDTARADETVNAVAERMLTSNVGSMPVVDETGRLAGIITDRDLALRVVAERREAQATRVAEVMTECLQTVREDAALEVALAAMRKRRVRRLPVVDAEDRLVGILTLDDVLALLGEELGATREILEGEAPRGVLEHLVPSEPSRTAAPRLVAPRQPPSGEHLERISRTLEEIRGSLDVVACALSIGLEVRLLGGGVIEGDVREAADRQLRQVLARAGEPVA